VTFERFLALVDNHPRCNILYDPSHMLLQQMDYLAFIDIYHARIKAFHVKDAEFRPNGRSGVYGGYQPGSTAPDASVRSATGRSTSKAFSAS
jgi:sugar phosphate isomerase/epimerase